ncbi:hypothetical protein JST97_18515 [bacterium]|nr:hypothetical protein [bacterium]
MKKNLLALVAVLILVAVAARLHQDPERLALERDLRVSLEKLWGTNDHQVDLLDAKGGVMVKVKVSLPKQGVVAWSDPFVRFVVARHPKIPLSGLEISPAADLPARPRIELLRRQAQTLVDGAVGAGHGLILLDGTEPAPPESPGRIELQDRSMERQGAPRARAPMEAAPDMRSNSVAPAPYFPAGPIITQECLIVPEDAPDDQVRQLQAQIQAEVPCNNFRVVRLPAQ